MTCEAVPERARATAPADGRATTEQAQIEAASQRMVSRFVGELMSWRAHLNHIDKLEHAAARPVAQHSPLARLARTAELGITGRGHRGTKGVWVGEGPVDALIDAAEANDTLALVRDRDAIARARFEALPFELQRAAAWLRDYSLGFAPPVLRPSDPPGYVIEIPAMGRRPERRYTGLSLATVLAFGAAPEEQRDRWRAKLHAGDASASLSGMRTLGDSLLVRGACAWFANSTPVS